VHFAPLRLNVVIHTKSDRTYYTNKIKCGKRQTTRKPTGMRTTETCKELVLSAGQHDTDWVIIIKELGSPTVHTSINVHKLVLCSFSNMFKGLFSTSRFSENEEQCSELLMTKEQGLCVSVIVNEFMYLGEMMVTVDNFVNICHIADYLQMSDLYSQAMLEYTITASNMCQHVGETLAIAQDGKSELYPLSEILTHICKSVVADHSKFTLDQIEAYLECCDRTKCTGFLDEDLDIEEQMSSLMRSWLYHNGKKYGNEQMRIQRLLSTHVKLWVDR
jgi:hypothetical protein